MPFTPFHMGPGLAVKAVCGRYFSLVVFGFSQVAIDINRSCVSSSNTTRGCSLRSKHGPWICLPTVQGLWELLMEHGPNLRLPHSRAFGDGLFDSAQRDALGLEELFTVSAQSTCRCASSVREEITSRHLTVS